MKLKYSPEAKADLEKLRQYLREVLQNKQAAQNVPARIIRECSALKRMPYMGMALSEKIGTPTDLRFLICGNHIAFYRVENDCVIIVRICDGRTQYLSVLFPHQNES